MAAAVTIGDNSRAELFHFVPVRQNGRLLMSLGEARELENLLKRQKGGVGLGQAQSFAQSRTQSGGALGRYRQERHRQSPLHRIV